MDKITVQDALRNYNMTELVTFTADEIAETLDSYKYMSIQSKSLFVRVMNNYPGLWNEIKSKTKNSSVIKKIEVWAKQMGVGQPLDYTYDLTNSHDKSTFKARVVEELRSRFVERMLEDGTWVRVGELK